MEKKSNKILLAIGGMLFILGMLTEIPILSAYISLKLKHADGGLLKSDTSTMEFLSSSLLSQFDFVHIGAALIGAGLVMLVITGVRLLIDKFAKK